LDTYEKAQGGNEGLNPKLCQHVHPEGHAKAGTQCRGGRGGSGYCPPHARALGLLPALNQPAAAAASAASSQPGDLQDAAAALAAASERAQLSFDASAAAWLQSAKTQKKLQARWDQILDSGSDAEVIRLHKELSDRVEGRAGERKVETEVEIPASIAALDQMSDAELVALSRTLHAEH
jgi:hypothetical protein